MVGPAELADFELMVFEQAVDSIWKSGDVVMHEVLEAGDGTERSLFGMKHLERVRRAEIADVSAEDSGNGVDEGYGGRVVYLYPGTSRSNAAGVAQGSTRVLSMRSALLLDLAGHLDFEDLELENSKAVVSAIVKCAYDGGRP
jgi:hypothetical protein